MIESIKPLHIIFKLNTKLFLNSLSNIDEDLGKKLLNKKTNNISFIAIHLLDARYFLCRYLGLKTDNPFQEQLKDVNSIEEMTINPKLDEIKNHWIKLSQRMENKITDLSGEVLKKKSEIDFPIDENSILGAISFLLQHESFHIGQIGFLRKSFGLAPMSYS